MFHERSNKPTRLNDLPGRTAIIALAGMLSMPALAATSAPMACPLDDKATLAVPFRVLDTEYADNSSRTVSSADDADRKPDLATARHLLAPQAEAAIRHAFRPLGAEPVAGTETEFERASDGEEPGEIVSRMNTRLPGMSDNEILQFRTHMYRRDI